MSFILTSTVESKIKFGNQTIKSSTCEKFIKTKP